MHIYIYTYMYIYTYVCLWISYRTSARECNLQIDTLTQMIFMYISGSDMYLHKKKTYCKIAQTGVCMRTPYIYIYIHIHLHTWLKWLCMQELHTWLKWLCMQELNLCMYHKYFLTIVVRLWDLQLIGDGCCVHAVLRTTRMPRWGRFDVVWGFGWCIKS